MLFLHISEVEIFILNLEKINKIRDNEMKDLYSLGILKFPSKFFIDINFRRVISIIGMIKVKNNLGFRRDSNL